ncbi:MAG: Diacylglycerol kinase [Firmicutes bacterium]|nr:Diacylglycerol kinase [Bacillota bacterium]
MQEIALIVNLTAGYGKCRLKYPEVTAYLEQHDVKVKSFFTEKRGHGEELARQAVREGFDVVVSMGGDGTLNEVVNGVAGSSATLGFIPAGAGNDFGRTFGLKNGEVTKACHVLLDGHARAVDLCRIDARYFINVAGAGFDAEVGHMANVWGKRYFSGATAYIASILRQLVAFSPREMIIELDEQRISTKVWMVAVANARYFGGGFMIAPTAEIDDGLLDVYIIQETSKAGLLMVLPRVMTGGHVSHPAVLFYRAKRVKLSSPYVLAAQADGELVDHLPQEFAITGEKINMILPRLAGPSGLPR